MFSTTRLFDPAVAPRLQALRPAWHRGSSEGRENFGGSTNFLGLKCSTEFEKGIPMSIKCPEFSSCVPKSEIFSLKNWRAGFHFAKFCLRMIWEISEKCPEIWTSNSGRHPGLLLSASNGIFEQIENILWEEDGVERNWDEKSSD